MKLFAAVALVGVLASANAMMGVPNFENAVPKSRSLQASNTPKCIGAFVTVITDFLERDCKGFAAAVS